MSLPIFFYCLLLWKNVSDCISVDPSDFAVINVGYLEHRVHPWVSRSAFKPDDLPHESVAVALLSHLLLSLNNHDLAWTNWNSFARVSWSHPNGKSRQTARMWQQQPDYARYKEKLNGEGWLVNRHEGMLIQIKPNAATQHAQLDHS